MKRKAQIRIMETIAILLIFFVLLVLGFVFFMRTASFTQEGKITKNQELQSIRVSQAISFLPELQCSSKNIITENCFDKYKLEVVKNNGGFSSDYYPLFYFSNITVEEIYPSSATQKWHLYERPSNGTFYRTIVPILIEDASERTKSFALLTVDYYPIQ